MQRLVLAAGALLVAGVASWTWMTWQRGQLVELQQQRAALQVDVDQMRAQVADLEKRGGRIKFAQCDTNRLCIEAALRITRDNRASAAEMLGLSRQGLYAKLRRYGIGDLDAPEPADEQ